MDLSLSLEGRISKSLRVGWEGVGHNLTFTPQGPETVQAIWLKQKIYADHIHHTYISELLAIQ